MIRAAPQQILAVLAKLNLLAAFGRVGRNTRYDSAVTDLITEGNRVVV